MRLPSAIALLAAALVGCSGPIAGMGYPGDPQFVVDGEVTVDAPMLAPMEATVAWQAQPGPWTSTIFLDPHIQRRKVSSADLRFQIVGYDSPPPNRLQPLHPGEVALVAGNAIAFPYGYQGDVNDLLIAHNAAFGLDAEHWLVYVAGDALPGTLTAWWLGQPLGRGYHVVRVTPFNPLCMTPAEVDACLAEMATYGVTDDGTTNFGKARFFCFAEYRLSPEPFATFSVHLGTYSLPPPPPCTP